MYHASRHREIKREINPAAIPVITLRDSSNQGNRIKYLIVEGKIVGGDMMQAKLLLKQPVLLAQCGGTGEKLLLTDAARPELLQCFL